MRISLSGHRLSHRSEFLFPSPDGKSDKRMMSITQEEDKKLEDQEAQIILKVKSQDGDEVFFKIKRSTRLKKLLHVYCDRRGLRLDAFAFFFDGRRINREVTPDELDMEDGDEIDALRTMSGGLRANQLQWSYMIFDHDQF